MLEVFERLRDMRSIRSKELRSRLEAALVKISFFLTAISFAQLLIVIAVTKAQQYMLLPPAHPVISGFAWYALGFLVLTILVLSSLVVIALLSVKKGAYEALLIEAKYDRSLAERDLIRFDKSELLAAKSFLESKAADIQERTTAFYSGGAVFLLALATAAWSVSKDLLGEQKLRDLASDHIANAAPALIAFAVGMSVIIAMFKPLKTMYGYHTRLIEIALALKDGARAKESEHRHPAQPNQGCLWCRFRRIVLRCDCEPVR